MKKIFLIAAAGMMTLSALAQPQLRKDNIDEVIKAMTLEEKATLLVGGARAVIVDGVPTGTAAKVPGAAGNTRPNVSAFREPSSPTALLVFVSPRPARTTRTPIMRPVSRWVPFLPAPGTSTSSRT